MNVIPFPKTPSRVLAEEYTEAKASSPSVFGELLAKRNANDRAQQLRIARAQAALNVCGAAQIGAGVALFWMMAAGHLFVLEIAAIASGAIGFGCLLIHRSGRL